MESKRTTSTDSIFKPESKDDKYTKPKDLPKKTESKKDFKKLVQEEEEPEEKEVKQSIFDLSSSKNITADTSGDEVVVNLDKKVPWQKTQQEGDEVVVNLDKKVPWQKTQQENVTIKPTQNPGSIFVHSTGKTEGMTINPNDAAKIADVDSLISQVVDNTYIASTSDSLSVSLSLKDPPLFEGAILTITEFATAKGEFNITFSGLSPDAKTLIDLQHNIDAMQQALQNKGYVAHIITTTQETDNLLASSEQSPNKYSSGDEQQQQQQQDDDSQYER